MNKPSKFALALAFAAVTASGAASAQTVDNWRNPFGDVWMNGTNELCWRDAFWTPATGIPGCDGVPVAQAPAKPTPMATKVVFNADTFFDFDKSTLKPEGRQLLDQVAQQAQIGRASCRERVCQYVLIPVVAVSLKNKYDS